jgi:formylglycine-generating enzyme required for sulfatase activity
MKTRNMNKFAGVLLAMLITPISGIAESARITIDVVSKDEFVLFLLKNYENRGFQCSEIRVQAKVVDKDGRVARRSIIALDVNLPANSLEIRLEAGKEVIAALRNEMNQPRIVDVSAPKYRCKTTIYITADKKVFRNVLKDGSLGPEMVWIPAGRFRMGDIQGGGDSDEKPVHWVSVDKFAMGRYELTVGEFRAFVKATGYKTDAEKEGDCLSWVGSANWRNPGFYQTENHPVVCVSWNNATAYAAWLSRQTGHTYRLPTEAQWEYAARAGTTTSRYWGNDQNDACRYANVADKTAKNKYSYWTIHNCTDGYVYTAPTGSFKPNAFDLFDMLGNVWEWTCSEYDNRYNGKESKCISQKSGSLRALRGGAWYDLPRYVRAAFRGRYSHGNRDGDVGVRLARRL